MLAPTIKIAPIKTKIDNASSYAKYPTTAISGRRRNSNGATTEAGARVSADVMQKCAVSPPILIIVIQCKDVIFGVAIFPCIPAKNKLNKNCIMVNQNKIQVTE